MVKEVENRLILVVALQPGHKVCCVYLCMMYLSI